MYNASNNKIHAWVLIFQIKKNPMATKSFGDFYGSLTLRIISVYVLEKN